MLEEFLNFGDAVKMDSKLKGLIIGSIIGSYRTDNFLVVSLF